MTLQEFIKKYNGLGNVGNTPENKGECVGLVMKWLEVQGLEHIWGHAFSLLTNADPDSYEVIKNTPDAIVEAGDIVVWGKGFNGTFGHTAIATKGTLNTLEVFEQNNPLGSPCRLHTYKNYAYIEGWLRPKSAIITQPTAQPDCREENRLLRLNNETLTKKLREYQESPTTVSNTPKTAYSWIGLLDYLSHLLGKT